MKLKAQMPNVKGMIKVQSPKREQLAGNTFLTFGHWDLIWTWTF
jgi:hypothetical protein